MKCRVCYLIVFLFLFRGTFPGPLGETTQEKRSVQVDDSENFVSSDTKQECINVVAFVGAWAGTIGMTWGLWCYAPHAALYGLKKTCPYYLFFLKNLFVAKVIARPAVILLAYNHFFRVLQVFYEVSAASLEAVFL